MKKINHALLFLGHRGGGPNFTYGMAFEKCEVFDLVILSQHTELLGLFEKDLDIEVCCYNLPHKLRNIYRIVNILRLVTFIAFNVREVTLTHYSPFVFFIFILRPFTNINYIMHDVKPHGRSLFQLLNHFVGSILCANIYVLSEYQKSLYSFPFIKKVTKIGHPLYHHYMSQNFIAQDFRLEHKKFLYFGRFEPYKDFSFLAELNYLIKKPIVNVIGSGEISQKIKDLDCCSVLNSYVADSTIPTMLMKCEYLLLPYNTATQSGLFPLAASFNKKIICFDLDVFREQAREFKVQTVFVARNDSKSFARVLIDLQ